jgi:hypothetical protein
VSASGGILKRQMIAALQKTRQSKLNFGVFVTFNEKYNLHFFISTVVFFTVASLCQSCWQLATVNLSISFPHNFARQYSISQQE